MVDTSPPKSQFSGPKNYYKGAARHSDGTWICENCQYADNKTCGQCMFAVWNIDGVLAGFSPDRAYREAHKDDLVGSPMMQKFSSDTVEARAGATEAQKRRSLAEKIAEKANEALREWERQGLIPPSGIRADPEWVRRYMGRSPIESGSPNLTSLPLVPTQIPGLPSRSDAAQAAQMLYEARRKLDH